MTREEATNILKAKLECYKCQTSETDFVCDDCDECSLNYEQGNMGGTNTCPCNGNHGVRR